MNGAHPKGLLLVLALALSATAAEADPPPRPGEPREVVSEPFDVVVQLPATPECGSTTVVRGDGTTIQVPRQGRFTQRCVTVRIVDATDRLISTDRRCDGPVFSSC